MKSEIIPLTSLRFFAAFYVFIFHIHTRIPITNNIFCCHVFNAGAVGMSLFFMLSGFVLAYRYHNQIISYHDYLINRFARIYPIYVVAALLAIPWFSVHGIKQGIILILANVFLVQAWFPQMFEYWNDGGSWSISVEAFFYILFPFIFTNLANQTSKKIALAGIGCYLFSVIPSLVQSFFGPIPMPVYYAIPFYRLPEFIIGICLCLLWKQHHNPKYATSCMAIALTVLGIYLGSGLFSSVHVGIGHNWIVIPIISIILVSVSSVEGWIAKILSIKPLAWLGKISYCFYSFQFLITLTFTNYRNEIINYFPILENNKIYLFSAFICLIAISAITHHLIEQPMQAWIRNKWKNRLSYSNSRDSSVS